MPTVAIGLVGEIRPANREQLGAFRQIEAVGTPLVDGAREASGAETFARERRLHRIIADLAALIVITEHARASICAPRQRPSSGLSSASGVSSQSISRLTQSSVSLAPIGPPNTRTPS